MINATTTAKCQKTYLHLQICHYDFGLWSSAVAVYFRFFFFKHFSVSVLTCLGGLFSKTEMSEVLTEILKVDPSFDKDSFLKLCERDIIPNILEVPGTAV